MKTEERAFPGKRLASVLFLLAFLCAAFSIVYAAVRVRLEDTRLTGDRAAAFSAGWSVETEGGATSLAEVSRPAAGRLAEPLRLRNALPADLSGELSLCFQTKNESVRVWVGSELVYTYGETPQRVYGHGVGAVWHLAPLPTDAGGRTVTVELTPIGGRTGLSPYRFLLGSRSALVFTLLRENLDMLLICALLALIGAVSLFIALVSVLRHSSWAAGSSLYFALFVLLASVWTAADSGLLQFLLHNKGVSYLLFGCSFYLLCTPFALFMAAMIPAQARLFQGFALLNSLYAALRIVLYMTGAADFEAALWLLHLVMASFILAVNLAIWVPVFRTARMDTPELCLAISSFTLIAAASLADFYLHDKMDQLRNGYSSGFYVGIMAFVLIAIMGVVRQARNMRQRAFQADFFERRAYTDELTGLLTTRGFDDKCAALLRTLKPRSACAVVDFDVNFFSQYNANNGLEAGDALLRAIAEGLRRVCREGELCARQEADHFVCMLRGGSFEEIMARIREADHSAREQMSQRMLLLSYGVTEVTDPGLSAAALRNQALMAKRTIKGNYERNIALYDHRLHEMQLQEMALLSGFEQSLQDGEYVIFLQPKISAETEALGGAEALVRRVAPDGTVTSAGPIIDALEQKGFVAKLDYYILEEVCRFQQRCLAEGRPPCPVSSNFSRVHLYDTDFPARVAETADRYRIPHELIEIELTETAFLAGKDVLQAAVRRLHDRGFRVAIDDFGSGYSSLNILKDVDVDVIKLDREFLADFAVNDRSGTIIEHTVRLTHQLGIKTVAEGIETAEQLSFLRRLGCELVQGYYYSRPLPVETFVERYLT